MNRTIEKYGNSKKSLALLMCDIDNFKMVNDTYGHECGDAVLRNIASIMITLCDGKGKAFRYGGEEVLLLLNLDKSGAETIAETIRGQVQAFDVLYNGSKINVTVTIGGALCSADIATIDEVVRIADDNLYIGKTNGKNCVVF